MAGKMQCKDIPDAPVLEFVAVHGGIGCTAWADDAGVPFERSTLNAMPVGVPPRLGAAKMKKLLQRGLVNGCPCGCRGDWELTDHGRAALRNHEASE